ncbi:recombinase family protein [Ornithinimicrobium ciconiae]|uniref:Recombinase family protein n=1 Tax=Ornithinimicrobium ciconiae TaxID=2594265 RepID=A0A516GF27_9MICO|nr:recombinase family protein [Ornithinimicrobium ciconiae]QDO89940.1 recombinase family protein [Ornithinimicrobium ciconiae]
MTLIGYARVSTEGQDLSTQVLALRGAGVEDRHIYTEKVSGKKPRPQLEQAIRTLREGDVLVTTRVDRIARRLSGLVQVMEATEQVGASLRVLDHGIDTSTPMGRAMLQVGGVFAEMEAALIAARTQEALAARGPGQRGGRPRALTAKQVADAKTRIEKGQPVSEVAAILAVSRATVYRAVR